MAKVYGLVLFEWDNLNTLLFNSDDDRDNYIDVYEPSSYRGFEYEIEEIYHAIDAMYFF